MNDYGRSEERRESPQTITPDDLSDAAIRRQLRLDALQHPATLLPLAVAIMATVFILVLSPLFGWLWPLVTLIVSVIVALGSFTWRSFMRFEGADQANHRGEG